MTGVETVRTDILPMEIHYLEEAYEKLCTELTLVMSIRDVNTQAAEALKNLIENNKGNVPFNLRIYEQGDVFYSDFFNFSTKINPEELIKSVSKDDLPFSYKIEMK